MKIKTLLLILSFNISIFSQNLIIKPIESSCLQQEKILFEKFSRVFCGIYDKNKIFDEVIKDSFFAEERDYLDCLPTALFFHALLDDQVVGYISCDLLPGHHIHIRQLLIDPEIFSVGLIKELLFTLLENYTKTKHISVSCLVGCFEMIEFFKGFGFIKIEPILLDSLQFCVTYELKIHSKCKICELLYPNVWENELIDDEELTNNEPQDLEGSDFVGNF